MYDKLLKLKEDKKWLFYLSIPLFLVVAGFEFYNRYLVNSGKKVVKDAEKKDEELKAAQLKAEQDAKTHEEKAREIEESMEKKKTSKDWHLQ